MRLTGVDAELLGMHVTGEGSLTGGNELAGRVVIGEFTPNAALQALLRGAVPPTVDVGALGLLALDTRFDTSLDTGRAALRDFELTRARRNGQRHARGAARRARQRVPRRRSQTSRFAPDALDDRRSPPCCRRTSPRASSACSSSSARFALDAGADTLTVQPLRAEAFGLRASGDVAGAQRLAAPRRGPARPASRNSRRRSCCSGSDCRRSRPPTRKRSRARPIDTRFTVTKDSAELDNLVLALDETTIKGTFALQGFDAPPYRFALDVDAVDADRYLPPKARDAQAGEATAGDIELPQNNTMNLDGTMQVGALKLAGMQFADVGSRIVIGGGDLKLENARAQPLRRHVRRQLPRARRRQRPGARARRARERHRSSSR